MLFRSDVKYISDDVHNAYLRKNNYKVIDSKTLPNGLYAVRTRRTIDNHFNFCLFGVQIFSMARRIMTEVISLAESIDVELFYSDTDSLFLKYEDLHRLEEAFRLKFDRELIGDELGSFKIELSNIVESYFVAKKIYLLKLEDGTFVNALKGIPQQSIDLYADIENVYKQLYQGEEVEFDLTNGREDLEFVPKNMRKRNIKVVS